MRKLLAWVSIAVVVLAVPGGAQQQAKVVPVKVASVSGPEAPAPELPVRRVVLYKNGVGYFEHLGRVRGNQDIHIDFTSGQLNDALASLTVLDLDGGRIGGVSYNSTAPFDRRLGALRLPLGEQTSVSKFLDALRGSRLDVASGTETISGRLLSVERKTRTAGGTTLEVDMISLVTNGGEIREIEVTPATRVRLADTSLHGEMNQYLGLLASEREQDLRRMTLATAGTGERQLFVSYISEVPVWKTTYRLVLSEKASKKPLLQGWAIVDNTVGEDWNNVELSLVAGAPQSFIQQLSQPYYGRRAVVALPQEYESAPQTHEARLLGGAQIAGRVVDPSGATIGGVQVRVLDNNGREITRTTSDDRGEYGFSGLGDGTYQLEFESRGFRKLVMNNAQIRGGVGGEQDATLQMGDVSQTVTVTAEAPEVNMTSSELAGNARSLGSGRGLGKASSFGGGLGGPAGGGTGGGAFRPGLAQTINELPLSGRDWSNLALIQPGVTSGAFNSLMQASTPAAAQGQDLGDLFEYKLKDRVTLKKNQSALVPIAQTEIEADKVSLWSGTSGAGRPLRAIWVKNTSPLTFDGGSFSVLDNEVFAGEGLTDPLKPDERRLLSYASDLGILVDAVQNSRPQHVTLAKISKGVLTQISEEEQRTLYTARSQEDSARTLVVEHPARPGWTLKKGAQEPEEKSPGTYRFRVSLAAKAVGAAIDLPSGPTLHGNPGGPPPEIPMSDFKTVTPMRYDEREEQMDPGRGKEIKRKG